MDYFKRFFGFTNQDDNSENFFFERNRNHHNFPATDDDEETTRTFQGPRGFSVFSDPLEMHQYFEQQMNEMMKSFGFGMQIFDNPEGFFGQFGNPSIEQGTQYPEDPGSSNPGDLREQFLKKGYEKPSQGLTSHEKKDIDLDEKIKQGNFDAILDEPSERSPTRKIVPFHHSPGMIFSGQSVSIKTITNPDGSIETHKTIKDEQGNEETTVCKRLGDKEYCVIKKRDKSGKEEVIENFVNMDENDTNLKPKPLQPRFPSANDPSSIYDKFFK